MHWNSIQAGIIVTAIISVIWSWRNPRYLLPLLLLALPLEISVTWFPHIKILDRLGSMLGGVSFGRLMTFVVLIYVGSVFWRQEIRQRSQQNGSLLISSVPDRMPLFCILGLYLLWSAFSLLWSVNAVLTMTEVVRLFVLFALGLAAAYQMDKYQSQWLVLTALAVISTCLGLIGIFEMGTQHFLWYGEIYQPLGRVNATFLDANIYARYLALGCLATFALMIYKKRWRFFFGGLPFLAIQLVALLGTGSRMGWLAAGAAMVIFIVLIPSRQGFLTLFCLALVAVLGILWQPQLLERVAELRHGLVAASTERQFLIQAGWDMFLKHPFLGVGLGGFQTMMMTFYPQLIINEVSRSHTALLTTAAELGLTGVLIVIAFLLFLCRSVLFQPKVWYTTLRDNQGRGKILLHAFSMLAVMVIFISAQGEGRFFEDPLLWLFVGLQTTLGNVRRAI